MDIKKHLPVRNELLLNDPVLDFEDREVFSYIYLKALDNINLEKCELEPFFMRHVLSEQNMLRLLNAYLSIMERNDNEKFESLKGENGFDSDKVLDAFSSDLKEHYGHFRDIFKSLLGFLEENYKGKNPLEQLLSSSFMKRFCDGLKLSHKERIFFILNLLNTKKDWIFPYSKNNDYKLSVLENFLDVEKENLPVIARNLNNRFIRLGLFSEEWTISDYVYSFFSGKTASFSLQSLLQKDYIDSYPYEELLKKNEAELTVWNKLIKNNVQNHKGAFELICGTEEFRLINFLKAFSLRNKVKLYKLNPEIIRASKNELNFYIYALTIQHCGKKAAILIPKNISELYLDPEKQKTTQFDNSGLLSNVHCTLILCHEKSQDSYDRDFLESQGINLQFSMELTLPEKDNYFEQACNYFAGTKVPADYTKVLVDFCVEKKLSPSRWPELSELFSDTKLLTEDEVLLLLESKYTSRKADNLRKNSHYCLQALNTSESISEIVDALKNAEEFQNEEYNEDSGVRILLTGPSGTGKTALVEQTAKELKKPLSIVRASDIISSYVGETEQNIKKAFEDAAKNKEILLIDEADSFLHSRGDNVNRHNDLKVNEFLIQMERFPGILFCNTNLPEALDKATDRRFHFKIAFKPLTRDGVEMLCKSYFKKFKLNENQINEIYSSGDVCPGDFGALYGKIRFVPKSKVDAKYITKELCEIVKSKSRSWEKKTIGFNA